MKNNNEIQFGLKLWSSNTDLIDEAFNLVKSDIFHYIEISPVPGTDIKKFVNPKVPYIVHITPEKYGINIADIKKYDLNMKLFKTCQQWADLLHAKYLILHPGFGSQRIAMKFLNELNDERILVENMPKVGMANEKLVGYLPRDIRLLLNDHFGFCLDLNHAVKAAISLGKDYREFINTCLKLNPKVFHISDGKLTYEKDEHLNIGEGNYDWNFLMKSILGWRPTYLTLETPRDAGSTANDLKNLTFIQKILEKLS